MHVYIVLGKVAYVCTSLYKAACTCTYSYTDVQVCIHKACIHVNTKVFILGYYAMRTFLFLLCDQMSQCVLHMIPAMGTLMWKENKMAALPQEPQLPSHVLMAMVLMEDTM